MISTGLDTAPQHIIHKNLPPPPVTSYIRSSLWAGESIFANKHRKNQGAWHGQPAAAHAYSQSPVIPYIFLSLYSSLFAISYLHVLSTGPNTVTEKVPSSSTANCHHHQNFLWGTIDCDGPYARNPFYILSPTRHGPHHVTLTSRLHRKQCQGWLPI